MIFHYQCGEKPLDGYTIKRGIGKGGFGEVYLAVSDGGKTVALKFISSNSDQEVERRGVSQCINIKHSNLVSLYDLCTNDRNQIWVVMELILGHTLASLISEKYNAGMPLFLVRNFFNQIAQAIYHLHDHGIVHRDLKPGNVFIENNIAKVGDYGLSKTIGAGMHLDNTKQVGTLNYMAPELINGKYDKKIDIYSLGVILFEMLSGKKPFSANSPTELTVKQLKNNIDFSEIKQKAFVPILAKSLAFDELQRYSSVLALLQDFETVCEGIDQKKAVLEFGSKPDVGLEAFNPSTISMIVKWVEKWNDKLIIPILKSALFACLTTLGFSLLGLLPSFRIGFMLSGVTWFLASSVIAFSLLWKGKKQESVSYRMMQAGIGAFGGIIAFALTQNNEVMEIFLTNPGVSLKVPEWSRMLFFYTASMFFPKWWKMAYRFRKTRVDYVATLISIVWALLLVSILNLEFIHALVFALTVSIVQGVAFKTKRVLKNS